MKQLVLKDFRVVGKVYIFLISLGVLFSTVSMITDNGVKAKLMYMLAIAVFAIFPHMSIIGKDIKYDSDELFNSLPITRNDLVVAKYIFIFVNIILSILFVFFYTNSLKILSTNTFSGNPMSYIDVLFVSSLLFMFFSVNLFITYVSIKKAQYFNQIFYMLIILIPTIASRILELTNLNEKLIYIATFDLSTIFSFTLLLGITLYIISMQLSKMIYRKKEF